MRLQLSEDEARALHAGLLDALAADLLTPVHAAAARRVLDRLGNKVPSWLERAPVGGETGYLMAAEWVLRALVDAEERGRTVLTEAELAHALADAKPVGVTIGDVLARMRREKLLRVIGRRGDQAASWSAAPAGRRLLTGRHGDVVASEWQIEDAEALVELIFREHRTGREAHRPSVQAIGRLGDERFDELAQVLRGHALLEPADEDSPRLALTQGGAEMAEQRVRATLPRHASLYELPAPPLPCRTGLPVRAAWEDRRCTCGSGHAAWLQRSSKAQLRRTLLRDGAAEWDCRWCGRRWLIYLQAHLARGAPAYEAPEQAIFNRPIWRPR